MMAGKIRGSRILSIITGLLLGAILGMWIYTFEGIFLAYGPWWQQYENLPISEEIRMAFFWDAFDYGALPGMVIGFIAGSVFPFLTPRGHMSKSIGCTLCLIETPLAWYTQRGNLEYMSAGMMALAIGITLVVFVMIIPISGFLGGFIEPLREKGLKPAEGG